MLARDVTTLMDEHGALYPFERVASLLQSADLTIANFEGSFTERGVEQPKLYTFRTPPRFASGLAQAGIDIVSLGNNHTADYGPDGVGDTIAALDAAGVKHAGAGMNEAEARQPAFIEAQGLRVAFLSYTDIMENTFAGPDSTGVALATTDAIAAGVRAARAQADAVIVALHSGVEYTDAPQPDQQQLARAAIDAGALLVLGHHPHALQGRERYRNGLIVYSLGNFVFDLDNDDLSNLGPRAFQTVVLYVTLRANEVVDFHVEPVTIDPNEDRPRPATADEAATINGRLADLDAIAGGS
jgi:poly-gamma-glutamate synthesis protein (capsule biosynthesis protein)